MVYALALLGNLLLASAALAAPSSRLADRLERRRNGRQSKPINRLMMDGKGVSDVQYSSNWAGAVYDTATTVRLFGAIRLALMKILILLP